MVTAVHADDVFIGRIRSWLIPAALGAGRYRWTNTYFLVPYIDAPPEEIVFCIDATPLKDPGRIGRSPAHHIDNTRVGVPIRERLRARRFGLATENFDRHLRDEIKLKYQYRR